MSAPGGEMRAVRLNGPLGRHMEEVAIIRRSSDGETRVDAFALMSAKAATFPLDTDLEEGDLIEQRLPSGKAKLYRATRVTYHSRRGLPASAQRVTAEIEPVTTRPAPADRRVEIPGMHPAVSQAAGALFADGHYSKAVLAAFQAVELQVQTKSGLTETGVPLMHRAFNPQSPIIDVARHDGRNAQDEREGFRFLFAGAMAGLRNPRAHGADLPDSEVEAIEYLALASALLRRI
jgi:uncharacterized protein (TIGR02391 family)